ncbi:hypothetical protein N8T08_007902 [Aspergillus melleus]|uniref:Uncharacterized protein n=1 Tax=Aspergillus melleus TaxID=138277 RepID=A0ACC3AWQ7_9EURO|nr:hypothetical protein N8T08_007902 [Aspergillus melleus]
MDKTADLEQPPQDHARNSGQTPLPVTAQPTSGANDSNYHAIQARNIIELELADCQAIGRERQSILRSALQLVSSVAENEPGHSGSIPENPRPTDPAITIPEAPPRELLFMLLGDIYLPFLPFKRLLTRRRLFRCRANSVARSYTAEDLRADGHDPAPSRSER